MNPIRVSARALILRESKVLLVECDCNDGAGLHYNLPGGGVEQGESIQDALKRELREEITCDVQVGRLLLVSEYFPPKLKNEFGDTHKLSLIFQCELAHAEEPRMPDKPDPCQIGLKWLPISALAKAYMSQYEIEQLKATLASSLNLFTEQKSQFVYALPEMNRTMLREYQANWEAVNARIGEESKVMTPDQRLAKMNFVMQLALQPEMLARRDAKDEELVRTRWTKLREGFGKADKYG
jgi:8-oxo-dGTP diphosphatase